jgi:formylglycine-generating enzyme required for sulfatase activity
VDVGGYGGGHGKPGQPNTAGYAKAFTGSTGSNSMADYAWYDNNSGSKTREAGKRAANELNLYDMSGNVWEWCWDRRQGNYPAGTQADYTGAVSGIYRVMRGGSWGNALPSERSLTGTTASPTAGTSVRVSEFRAPKRAMCSRTLPLISPRKPRKPRRGFPSCR